eukprot:CAMPEP_0182928462 /NCGR_PEP_ID=MMETSP0105_2-20130417/15599_1 /TAXON_ID=81532 ORGANISM="Acanthoeca-like sp., Strain 10tr" /NCGR_SAMPLE_ID=MMETSP0105_2 /ASSEMBLY_ACC=CAM_ASM_000205 /LENGTH=71 /DNA_ID=CAMNT_0025066465 /DNA_START=627 /DNA_END=839 /DNA_ORIENTATION=-
MSPMLRPLKASPPATENVPWNSSSSRSLPKLIVLIGIRIASTRDPVDAPLPLSALSPASSLPSASVAPSAL